MKKIILILLLFITFSSYSQNKTHDSIFVMIDIVNFEKFYRFQKDKSNKNAKVKILHFDKRNEGFKLTKRKKLKGEDIVAVKAEPKNTYYYEFVSIKEPKIINSIKNMKTFSLEDVSKNNKNVWFKYPYTIFFIEKIKCNSFRLWEMNPIFQE